MAQITYANKETLNEQPSVADKNKVKASDMNEIKQVVNGNYNTLIGSIFMYAGSTAPIGYLICDGSAISRSTYSDLFSVIGTTYGSGDGSTTFNIPNLKGKVVVGQDSNDTSFDTLGETGGEKEHTLTIDEMPSHNHSIITRLNATSFSYPLGAVRGNGGTTETTTSGMINNTGGDEPHNNMQPYVVLNYIIRY